MSPITHTSTVVQDDHRELMSLVDTLRRRFDGDPWAETPVVGSLLESLTEHLETHFQHEEENGGLFEEVLDLAPHTSPRVDALLNEHQRMLMLADDLLHRYRRAPRRVAAWRELGDAFARLRQMLLVHECEERSLLHESFSQDVGSKD